jgi:Flp pilus assembly protein TadD
MGWLALAALMAGSLALFWRMGLPRDLLAFVGAALMLGAAGYALQARPALSGQPARGVATDAVDQPQLVEQRRAMLGRFTVAEPYFFASDALMRSGAKRSAVGVLLGGVNSNPQDFALWTALGTAYAEHDGVVSPAARLAFDRAMKISPDHPAPPFFLGLAQVRAGEFRAAQRSWRHALALTPQGLSYRPEIARRLELLDAFLASEAGRAAR